MTILSRDMSKNVFLGPKCPNLIIRPQTHQKLKILNIFTATRSVLPVRFQQALNHYQMAILSRDMFKKLFIAPQMPTYGNSASDPPKIERFEHFYCY